MLFSLFSPLPNIQAASASLFFIYIFLPISKIKVVLPNVHLEIHSMTERSRHM